MVSLRRAGTTDPFKSIGPSSSPVTYVVISSEFNGASRVSSSGSDGASSVSSSYPLCLVLAIRWRLPCLLRRIRRRLLCSLFRFQRPLSCLLFGVEWNFPCLLFEVHGHVVYLHHIVRFRRHRQRCPSPRAPSYICAGPLLARHCFHRLSRFRCQRQRHPFTRSPSHICAGPPLAHRLYFYHLIRFCCQRQRCPFTRVRLSPVAENNPLRGQKLKTSDSSPGNSKTAFVL